MRGYRATECRIPCPCGSSIEQGRSWARNRWIRDDGWLEIYAFNGRVSTAGFQDKDSSRTWQRQQAAEAVVAGHGSIVAEFFDVGVRVRRVGPGPQAAALLKALRDSSGV